MNQNDYLDDDSDPLRGARGVLAGIVLSVYVWSAGYLLWRFVPWREIGDRLGWFVAQVAR